MVPLTGLGSFAKVASFCGLRKSAANLPKRMDKQQVIREGVVSETLPGARFRVRLDEGKEILCHLAGKLRVHFIRILPGDRVRVEMGPYDDTKGRIVYRIK